jgi:hypothetical protein
MGLPRQACSLVIIGLSITVGLGLFLTGSFVGQNYVAIAALIPASLAGLCFYGMRTTTDPMSEPGIVSYDSWVFLFVFFLVSTFGLPMMVGHVFSLGATSIGLDVGGALVIVVGFAIAQFLAKDPSESNW